MTQRQVRPLRMPVVTSSTHHGQRSRRGRLSLRRTSKGACRTAGEWHSTSDRRDYAALVSPRDPLKMMVTETLTLLFSEIPGRSHGWGDLFKDR